MEEETVQGLPFIELCHAAAREEGSLLIADDFIAFAEVCGEVSLTESTKVLKREIGYP